MTDDRKPLPAEAEMVLLPCPFCGGDAERIDVPDEDDVDGGVNAGGSCIQCKRCSASTGLHFDRKENLIAAWNERAALTAAPKATEAPGLREAAQATLNGAMKYNGSYLIPVSLLYRLRAALSATPQPVAVTDGAGRDEAWRYDIQYGPDGEAIYAWVYDETGRMVGTMRTFHAATICALASALSAERAAHEQTRQERDMQHGEARNYADLALRAGNETADAIAEVARLRKALEAIAGQKKTNELLTEYDAEVADFETGYDTCIDVARAAVRSSREEGK